MIQITEAAQRYISHLLADEDRRGHALYLAITGRRPGGFRYKLAFMREDEKAADDLVVDADGFKLIIDAESAPNLQGATLGLYDSGFKIENPNAVWTDPKATAVQKLLDELINPALAEHGGYVSLLDVKEDIAYMEFSGGCQGCGMAGVTMNQGIKEVIMEEVPGIRDVVDVTDHASGTNPYYQPGKGGESPLS
jgi:Fe/S biogenesis protein NfuA